MNINNTHEFPEFIFMKKGDKSPSQIISWIYRLGLVYTSNPIDNFQCLVNIDLNHCKWSSEN